MGVKVDGLVPAQVLPETRWLTLPISAPPFGALVGVQQTLLPLYSYLPFLTIVQPHFVVVSNHLKCSVYAALEKNSLREVTKKPANPEIPFLHCAVGHCALA